MLESISILAMSLILLWLTIQARRLEEKVDANEFHCNHLFETTTANIDFNNGLCQVMRADAQALHNR